ncbi:glycosyltransferase [Microbulbifer bruguierae]|uniref:Glycosyltransferase n=1 Tax=Microbulbifer bruguierae TaxID=3029061 RepID=A0ABY8NIY8_9GAMM|nr:glycosyltransferase [Microbulbifer bruguierae]WGL17553.1 glycosyltransferase [Microbulbifer bruguierae]
MSTKKREIIICALGTAGDIHPLIGLAKLLVERGHNLTFLSNDRFKFVIERNGILFHSIGTEDEYLSLYNDERAWDIRSDPAEIAFDRYYGPTFVPSFEFIRKRHAKNPNLLVVGLSILNGARAAAKHFSIPYVLITLSPSLIPSKIHRPALFESSLCRWTPEFAKRSLYNHLMQKIDGHLISHGYIFRLNQIRKKIGLSSITKFVRHNYTEEDLHLGFFPRWFGMPPVDWPKTFKLVGFPLSDDERKTETEAVSKFIERYGKPVLFTSGTGVFNNDAYFQESIKACSSLSLPCLLVGGGDSLKWRKTTYNVMHVDYVDFETILPKCRAIVHHGGVGTLSQAIKAEIPQLIRPLMYDQPDNAYRVVRLGLGLSVSKEYYQGKYVAKLLNKIITCKSLKSTTEKYSRDLKRSTAIEKSYHYISKL